LPVRALFNGADYNPMTNAKLITKLASPALRLLINPHYKRMSLISIPKTTENNFQYSLHRLACSDDYQLRKEVRQGILIDARTERQKAAMDDPGLGLSNVC
jgi:hypothetical protein